MQTAVMGGNSIKELLDKSYFKDYRETFSCVSTEDSPFSYVYFQEGVVREKKKAEPSAEEEK